MRRGFCSVFCIFDIHDCAMVPPDWTSLACLRQASSGSVKAERCNSNIRIDLYTGGCRLSPNSRGTTCFVTAESAAEKEPTKGQINTCTSETGKVTGAPLPTKSASTHQSGPVGHSSECRGQVNPSQPKLKETARPSLRVQVLTVDVRGPSKKPGRARVTSAMAQWLTPKRNCTKGHCHPLPAKRLHLGPRI